MLKLSPNGTFGAESAVLNEKGVGTALLNADTSAEGFDELKPKAGLAGACVITSDLAGTPTENQTITKKCFK